MICDNSDFVEIESINQFWNRKQHNTRIKINGLGINICKDIISFKYRNVIIVLFRNKCIIRTRNANVHFKEGEKEAPTIKKKIKMKQMDKALRNELFYSGLEMRAFNRAAQEELNNELRKDEENRFDPEGDVFYYRVKYLNRAEKARKLKGSERKEYTDL